MHGHPAKSKFISKLNKPHMHTNQVGREIGCYFVKSLATEKFEAAPLAGSMRAGGSERPYGAIRWVLNRGRPSSILVSRLHVCSCRRRARRTVRQIRCRTIAILKVQQEATKISQPKGPRRRRFGAIVERRWRRKSVAVLRVVVALPNPTKPSQPARRLARRYNLCSLFESVSCCSLDKL